MIITHIRAQTERHGRGHIVLRSEDRAHFADFIYEGSGRWKLWAPNSVILDTAQMTALRDAIDTVLSFGLGGQPTVPDPDQPDLFEAAL